MNLAGLFIRVEIGTRTFKADSERLAAEIKPISNADAQRISAALQTEFTKPKYKKPPKDA